MCLKSAAGIYPKIIRFSPLFSDGFHSDLILVISLLFYSIFTWIIKVYYGKSMLIS